MPKQDQYKCSHCGVRHPQTQKVCFYCGKMDSIVYDQIKQVPRKAQQRLGATFTIRLK